MDPREDGVPDEKLVSLARDGNDAAYMELVARYKGRVLGMAARIARDSLEADELGQEVFVKAFDRLGQYRGDAPFGHWLLRIATNTFRDALRKRKGARAEVPLDTVEHALSGNSGEGEGESGEELLLLERAIGRLKEDDRMLITLLELEGRTVKEVAGALGISEGNVKVRAHRARKKLKVLFEEERIGNG